MTEKQEMFLEERHRELKRRVDTLGETLRGVDESAAGAPAEILSLLAGEGLLESALPERREDADLRSLTVVRESLARASVLADHVFSAQTQGAHLAWLAGSPAQQEAVVAPARAGQQAVALALGEGGSDAEIAVTARAEGDDHVLDGVKPFVRSAGPADCFTVLARSGEGDGGLTFFLVEGDRDGLQSEARQLLGGVPAWEVRLEGVRVPAGNRLGGEGEGAGLARQLRSFFAPAQGAAALGLAAWALDETVRWLQSGKGAAGSQGVQHRLADMAMGLDGARLLVQRAAAEHDAGRVRPDLAAMAKGFAAETAGTVVDGAVQLHGEAALVAGSTVERLYRAVRALRLEGGATEQHRDIVARELLAR